MLRRRMLIMLGVVLLIVLILGGYKAFSIYQQIQQFSAPRPPVSVAATAAREQLWQSRLSAVGSLKAFQGVNLSLETAGTVKTLLFESGQRIRVGQPLLQLDSDVESALLGTAMADLGLAQVEYGRGSQLIDSQAISKGEFDRLAAKPWSPNSKVPWRKRRSLRRSAVPLVSARSISATTCPVAQ